MPEIRIVSGKCPRCGKSFEDSERCYFLGKRCRECTILAKKINQLEKKLLTQEFSIEKNDEELARQLNDILSKESSGISEVYERLHFFG